MIVCFVLAPYHNLTDTFLTAIRSSPEALEIIYGLGDAIPFQTIFWPMYMSY